MVATPSVVGLPGLDAELARVEEALRSAVVADDDYLTELASHLIAAGGKRIRPALTVTAASTGSGPGPVGDDTVMAGVAVELVHLGSLYHDDVIDEASTRRGVTSVNARWGNLRAILAGDFLLARASGIGASLGPEVAGLLAGTISSLCQGEVRELQTAFNPRRTEDQYLTAIAGKTASLFAASCRIGALVVGLDRLEVEALTAFGRSFGMAFQIVDDVLDVVSTKEELGKPAGNDLAEGVYTLPVIRALASPGPGDELAGLLGGPLESDAVERACELVRSDGSVGAALVVARRYRDEALGALEAVPPGPAADRLAAAVSDLPERVPAS